MKKSKLLVAAVTASVLALGGGALAGCNKHSHEYSQDWQKDGTGHWHVATCDDLKEGDKDYIKDYAEHVWGDDNECDVCHYVKTPAATEYTVTLNAGAGTLTGATSLTTVDGKIAELPTPTAPADHWFKGWYTEDGGNGDKVTADTVFTDAATIYAHYVAECTVTLSVGTYGTLPSGTVTTIKTVNGKVSNLPDPTVSNEHMEFDAWYTTATAGVEVTDEYVFEADATIHAQYLRENGVWVGDTFQKALVKNAGASLINGLKAEYWLGGSKVTLEKGDEVSLYIKGKLVPFYVIGSSAGIDKPAASEQVTSVTVSIAGEFAIYLKDYSSDSNPTNWSCEFAGPTEVNVGTEVPVGCDAVHITLGTSDVTLYLVDGDGNSVGAADFGKYCIYTFNGEAFGNWKGSETNGLLQAEMTGAVTSMPEGWIIRWKAGSSTEFNAQCANITGLVAGSTYLIELPSANQGTPKVTKLELAD